MKSSLDDLVAWQAAEPGRYCDIDIRPKGYPNENENEIKIWVYSFILQIGQFIEDVSEIDLPAKFKIAERVKYEELKKKFEPLTTLVKEGKLNDRGERILHRTETENL